MSWLSCRVTTQAVWPNEQKEVKYGKHTFTLMPLTKEHSASVHIELKGISHIEGQTLIKRFLSALAWKCDALAITHNGWSGHSKPVPMSRHRIPCGDSSPLFPNEVYEIADEKAKLAVALYRDARSLDSVPFRFLSFFKILNIFWNDKMRKGKNELVEGLRASLLNLTEEDCIKRIKEIESREGDVANYLHKKGRCAVAHAFADPIVDPDVVTDLHRLSKDLWLMQKLAAYLIEKNFGIEQSIWD